MLLVFCRSGENPAAGPVCAAGVPKGGHRRAAGGNATGGPVFRRTAMRLSQLKENAGVAIRYGAGRYPEVQ